MIHPSSNSVVEKLIGLVLVSINVPADFVRLLFEEGWELAIYNPFTVEVSGKRVPLGDGGLLVGKTVVRCVTTHDECLLQLSSDVSLRVDLRDEVFVGPEAMQLIGPAGEIIIWN